ncbi:MAG: GAF domain-containing protein [Anaerolineales bacterium]|nr:GAF domain-containing protein [Anaerolineales bacterium]
MNNNLNRLDTSSTRSYALIGALFGASFPVIGTLIRLVLLDLPISLANMIVAQTSDPLLWVVDTAPFVLGAFAAYAGYKQDQVTHINKELYQRESDLRINQITLEQRVEERTAELSTANRSIERRARQFEAIGQASRAIISTQNLQDLLPQITKVISQYFGFYHTGIFLFDPNREYVVLSAANSEGGQRMLDRNHKLRVGEVGIVGYVAGTSKPRIALDTGTDAIYFNNPDLPDTRSEMALPLIQIGGSIIGVLDIQSTESNAFTNEDINILSTLADQISVAIANALRYDETQKTLLEAEMLYRSDLQSKWKQFMKTESIAGIRRSGMKSNLYSDAVNLPGASEVTRSGSPFVTSDDGSMITLPVKLRGEMVGILNIQAENQRKWTNDEMDIINAILERAAVSLENARLLTESRITAERERVISEVTARVGSSTEIETILKTAVRELGDQIGGARVTVEMGGDHE